ncbi:putative ribonuclease H protein [Vitis vinifera]|uniref:Putative ribonuclease H protein n=1 Tax=Vitis vinifera TaxID=29760 RepID=A0A438IDN6_VITVI|nr:putative ribonuclease H protein [Vitis vinifera]
MLDFQGGRITLIRSTLANMLIYFMSMLSMPRKVRLRLERIQREFLWEGGALERKIHLVKWELVCLEKDNGGLGVKSLSILNKALLCKWSWRFAMEREAFWNQVIRENMGGARGMEFKGSKGETHGVGLWKTLRKEWEVVKSRLVFVVGNGKRIKFWKDIWCGDEPLCVSFPSLFALAVSKDAWVKDVWRCNEGVGSWSPLFSRPFNDWELEENSLGAALLNVRGAVGLPATVKETLSGWNGSFCGEEEEGCLESKSFVPFLDGLEDKEQSCF